MKTIGLVGGMSWESTELYYRAINKAVRERLGGFHSAKIALYSVDFDEVEAMQREGRWEEAGALLSEAAGRVEAAGADFVLLCTNTMHRVADEVERGIDIPLLHVADATAAAVRKAGIQFVGLLGTRFTMEEDFYRGRLSERHGLQVIVPDEADRALVHRVIYDELCHGKVLDPSRERFIAIIRTLVNRGAGGIILGCTEIGMLIGAEQSPVPVFDTTRIHATAAVDRALAVA